MTRISGIGGIREVGCWTATTGLHGRGGQYVDVTFGGVDGHWMSVGVDGGTSRNMVGEQVRGRSWALLSNASDGDTLLQGSGLRRGAVVALESSSSSTRVGASFTCSRRRRVFRYQLVIYQSLRLRSFFHCRSSYWSSMWSLLRASSCGGWGDPHNKTAPSLYIKGVPSPCTPPPFVPSLPHAVNIGC